MWTILKSFILVFPAFKIFVILWIQNPDLNFRVKISGWNIWFSTWLKQSLDPCLQPVGARGEWREQQFQETRYSLIPQPAASNGHFALDLGLSRWMSQASAPVISLTSTSLAPLQCTLVSSAALFLTSCAPNFPPNCPQNIYLWCISFSSMFLFPPSTQHVIQVELAAIITHSVVKYWFLKATSPWTLLMCFFRFLIFSHTNFPTLRFYPSLLGFLRWTFNT